MVLEAMVKADRDEELARLGYEMVLQVGTESISFDFIRFPTIFIHLLKMIKHIKLIQLKKGMP